MTYKLPRPVVVSNGGTGDTSLTAYAVLCGGTTTTGAVQSIASVGTSGQLLTSNGAGALPTMQAAPAAGGLVKIQTQTASNSANLSFTTGITSTYTTYMFTLNNVVPATNAVTLNVTVTVDGGSNYLATGYLAGVNSNPYNSATITNANSTTAMPLTGAQVNTSTVGVSGNVYFYNITTANLPEMTAQINWNSGSQQVGLAVANNSTTTGVNGFRFVFSSGNISSGSITLYGVTK